MNTIEGNKLIADSPFASENHIKIICKLIKYEKSADRFYNEAKYHTSWDWLMPVVEKIGLIPFPKDIGWKEKDYKDFSAYPYPRTFGMRNAEGKFMVRLNASQLYEADTLIEATWLSVIDYIKWYNQNNQP